MSQADDWKPVIPNYHLDGDGLSMPQSGRWILGQGPGGIEPYIRVNQKESITSIRRVCRWYVMRVGVFMECRPQYWRLLTSDIRLQWKIPQDMPQVPWSLVENVNGQLVFKDRVQ